MYCVSVVAKPRRAIWGSRRHFFNSKIECQNVNEPLKCQPNICPEWNTHGDRATQDVTILCNIRKLRLFAKKWAQSISNTSVTRQPWNEVFNQRALPTKSIFNDGFHIVLLWNNFLWFDMTIIRVNT